ncbi:MAG: orotidine-5'-phosphate decarboxylase [Myxococcales bacterium]|nr:orotidine-5'-phosphate decarboxylase [Myxococcales bacterium]
MSAQAKLAIGMSQRGPLCIGLDPDRDRLPACVRGDVAVFLREIIATTADIACGFKINSAFFESMGLDASGEGHVLASTRAALPSSALFIWDGKRGDIGNTNRHYAHAAFEVLGADAVTVHPYLGLEPLEPFLRYRERLTFVLCATSEGSQMQDLCISDREGEAMAQPLWQWVARKVAQQSDGQCGLVVGATQPERLAWVRKVAPQLPLLVPGVGAQGGQIPAQGSGAPLLINASRSILYASAGPDFAAAARAAALSLRTACVNASVASAIAPNPVSH